LQLGFAEDAVDFAAYLVKTCVIEEAGVSNTEFYNVIDALGKVMFSRILSFLDRRVGLSGSSIVIR
jgi:hypothetical protein